eukprot:CAMPEP_0201488924 /NCGR_PEP_ID=MMETSP0151_2-20130828/20391_1 /ASSEMBLY_ACC=CAM_ASM_000257 /TAXON_ID=200890 /ORGANISM="Paramoeba atlantica, Strain 621/1 / CCAP 1560/9" /LENGTH=248 /DNA_ID=CAMNT_0047874351 /DNA_START=75 /DNA_END=821 /DNA_ORIENTATION=+
MALDLTTEDVQRMLACKVHIGTKNRTSGIERYIAGTKKDDGINIINLYGTWEKLILAARIVVAIENPKDVMVVSSRLLGQRAVLKFAHYTGATYVAGRFTPGMLTNHAQKTFRQPRLLIVTDPRTDHQAITEATYCNIPVLALCDTDSPMGKLDVAIPCNNRGAHSIGLLWWLLAREVLRMRGRVPRYVPWEVVPDLFFYRDPDEVMKKKEEQAAAAPAADSAAGQPPQSNVEWGVEDNQNPYNWGTE